VIWKAPFNARHGKVGLTTGQGQDPRPFPDEREGGEFQREEEEKNGEEKRREEKRREEKRREEVDSRSSRRA
jgi:hypothetical protein